MYASPFNVRPPTVILFVVVLPLSVTSSKVNEPPEGKLVSWLPSPIKLVAVTSPVTSKSPVIESPVTFTKALFDQVCVATSLLLI